MSPLLKHFTTGIQPGSFIVSLFHRSVRWVLLPSPFYLWRSWNSESLVTIPANYPILLPCSVPYLWPRLRSLICKSSLYRKHAHLLWSLLAAFLLTFQLLLVMEVFSICVGGLRVSFLCCQDFFIYGAISEKSLGIGWRSLFCSADVTIMNVPAPRYIRLRNIWERCRRAEKYAFAVLGQAKTWKISGREEP